jgi:hypothetical protein
MTDAVDSFLRQVRQSPKFIEAAQADAKLLRHFNEMEWGLRGLAESDEGFVIEAFDEVRRAVVREDWTLKQKLLEIVRLAAIIRDHGRSVH